MISHLSQILQAAGVTLSASVAAIALALVFGLSAGAMEQSRLRILRIIAAFYVSIIRGTPLYIQLLVIFFLLPAVGIDLPSFATGVLALGLNSGAYISQMIGGALTAIPAGQIEAANALAMDRRTIWRRILVPQAMRLILPPMTIEFTALVKNSAFLSVIGVVELTRTAQQIAAATFEPTQTWIAVAAVYFMICFVLSLFAKWLEWKTSRQAAR